MTAYQQRLASATTIDEHFMLQALALAERGKYTVAPNPMVGCVLVQEQKVVGNGWHEYAGGPHAEIKALHDAGDLARGATCYVTLEPCCHYGRTPPCANQLLAAGIRRVVAAMIDPNPKVAGGGIKLLRSHGVEVITGVLAANAKELNQEFILCMQSQ